MELASTPPARRVGHSQSLIHVVKSLSRASSSSKRLSDDAFCSIRTTRWSSSSSWIDGSTSRGKRTHAATPGRALGGLHANQEESPRPVSTRKLRQASSKASSLKIN